jgi:hypothetical protein
MEGVQIIEKTDWNLKIKNKKYEIWNMKLKNRLKILTKNIKNDWTPKLKN